MPAADWFAVADALSGEFARTARAREQQRTRPIDEIAALKRSGLLTLATPREYGGEGLGWGDLTRIVRRISRGDTSLGMLLGVHYIATTILWRHGVEGAGAEVLRAAIDQRWYLGCVYNPLETQVLAAFDGAGATLNGRKSFCTGAPLADRILVMAKRADTLAPVNFVVRPDLAGLTIASDWDAMGMRLADSSGVDFADVRVGADALVSAAGGAGELTPWRSAFGLAVWLLYTNYYVGAAQGAMDFAKDYTLTTSRPWISAGVDRASQDPYILQLYGQLHIDLTAAEVLVDRAADVIDAVLACGPDLDEDSRAQAAITLFTARVAASRAALDTTGRLFEAMGARATSDRVGFDRFWRDVRTHTLHHPLSHKVKEIGDYVLNGTHPNYRAGYA